MEAPRVAEREETIHPDSPQKVRSPAETPAQALHLQSYCVKTLKLGNLSQGPQTLTLWDTYSYSVSVSQNYSSKTMLGNLLFYLDEEPTLDGQYPRWTG